MPHGDDQIPAEKQVSVSDDLPVFEPHPALSKTIASIEQMNRLVEPFRGFTSKLDGMMALSRAMDPLWSVGKQYTGLAKAVRPTFEEIAPLSSKLVGQLAGLSIADKIAPFTKSLSATERLVQQIGRDVAMVAKITEPICGVMDVFEQHRELASWMGSLNFEAFTFPIPDLKLGRTLERATEAATRLLRDWRPPTERELVHSAAIAARRQDQAALERFTVDALALPRRYWHRVAAELYLANWRRSREPLRLLREAVIRDVTGQSRSRMAQRIDYAHACPKGEVPEGQWDPWEQVRSRIWTSEQITTALPLKNEERELLALKVRNMTYPAAAKKLRWNPRRLARVKRSLNRKLAETDLPEED